MGEKGLAASERAIDSTTGPNSNLNNAPGGGLGDLSQSQQQKLQAFEDFKSKASEELSNALKKASDADEAITRNIK